MKNPTKATAAFRLASCLAPAFSPAILHDLGKYGESKALRRIVREQSTTASRFLGESVADFYDQVYDHLYGNYRNEYVFKNVLTQKVLLGKHSPRTSTMVPELRVPTAKLILCS